MEILAWLLKNDSVIGIALAWDYHDVEDSGQNAETCFDKERRACP